MSNLEGRYKQSYVSEFLSFKCAGDVLNIVNPVKRAEKEISESMAIINKLRPLVLADPMKYTLIDMCAGNALANLFNLNL